jgi:hypothetical protein
VGVKGVDGWEQGLCPSQAPPEVMVYGEAISDGAVIVTLRPAALDLIELLPPRRIRVLLMGKSARNAWHGGEWMLTLKDAARPFVMSPTMISG